VLSIEVRGCLSGWMTIFQRISQDWEGLRMSSLAQRWRLVWGWCVHLDFWKSCNCSKVCKKRPKCNFLFPLARWHHVYAKTACTWRHYASGFSTRYLRQCGALRTLWWWLSYLFIKVCMFHVAKKFKHAGSHQVDIKQSYLKLIGSYTWYSTP